MLHSPLCDVASGLCFGEVGWKCCETSSHITGHELGKGRTCSFFLVLGCDCGLAAGELYPHRRRMAKDGYCLFFFFFNGGRDGKKKWQLEGRPCVPVPDPIWRWGGGEIAAVMPNFFLTCFGLVVSKPTLLVFVFFFNLFLFFFQI